MNKEQLFNLRRMDNMPEGGINSVQGLNVIAEQFLQPDFKMAEVGSFEGISTLLFSKFVNTVYSIDYYDYKVPETGRIPEHDQSFIEAERLFNERTKDIKNIIKIRKKSMDAVKDFPDRFLDAVYIDGEHDEPSVREDIREWRKKVKFGGYLMGHDYYLPYIQTILNEHHLLQVSVAPDSSWIARIPSVTLASVACTKVPETIEAIRKCQAQMGFNRSILFTNEDIQVEGIEVIKIDKLDYKGYNEFVVMKLWQYIGTDFVLLVQNDSWILNASKWRDEWMRYDYIGAGWPIPDDNLTYRRPDGELIRVGNGGFTLRSRRLLRAPTILDLKFSDMGTGHPNEDGFLCVHYGRELTNAGIKFAPLSEAVLFSRELDIPELVNKNTFGFHRYL